LMVRMPGDTIACLSAVNVRFVLAFLIAISEDSDARGEMPVLPPFLLISRKCSMSDWGIELTIPIPGSSNVTL